MTCDNFTYTSVPVADYKPSYNTDYVASLIKFSTSLQHRAIVDPYSRALIGLGPLDVGCSMMKYSNTVLMACISKSELMFCTMMTAGCYVLLTLMLPFQY